MIKKSLIYKIIFGLVIFFILVFAFIKVAENNRIRNTGIGARLQNGISDLETNLPAIKNKDSQGLPSKVLIDIPFTSQAPLGNWDDNRLENGCEEANVLMAMNWINNKTLTPQEAEEAILKISEFETEHYDNAVDTSAADTKKMAEDYFDYHKIDIKYDISVQDIKKELADGNIVLVPTNGQALNNPFYKAPGPERHFLLIRGYDDIFHNFITNDSGTKHGDEYKYHYDVLYNAIRDYPSGNELPINGYKKVMLVFHK